MGVVVGGSDGGLQDFLLLGALGVSVLVGVFASQLAAQTWDSVLEEVEAEKQAKAEAGRMMTQRRTMALSASFLDLNCLNGLWAFSCHCKKPMSVSLSLFRRECEAQVWNYTAATDDSLAIPASLDPAQQPGSPEIAGAYQGIDLGASVCDGLVLTPQLFGAFVKYADPLYDPNKDDDGSGNPTGRLLSGASKPSSSSASKAAEDAEYAARQELLSRLDTVKSVTRKRIQELDERIRQGSD